MKIELIGGGGKGDGPAKSLFEALEAAFGGMGKEAREKKIAERKERQRVTEERLKNAGVSELDQKLYYSLFGGLRGDSFNEFFSVLVWLTEQVDSLEAARLAYQITLFLKNSIVTLQNVDEKLGTQFVKGDDAYVAAEYDETLRCAKEALDKVEAKHALAASLQGA